MVEWVLVVWLLIPGAAIADPVEIGSYRFEGDCNRARDSYDPSPGVNFIAWCVERDK